MSKRHLRQPRLTPPPLFGQGTIGRNSLWSVPNNNLTPLFSSLTDEWPTPQRLFDALHAEFGFTLDPCATEANAKCGRYFTRAEDGLKQDWSRDVVFMNPPYGRMIGHWVKKAYESARQGALVVSLLPARTDTRWWHDYVMRGEIRLLRGRLTFEGGKYPAPFPSAIVVFRPPDFRLISVGSDFPIRIPPARLPAPARAEGPTHAVAERVAPSEYAGHRELVRAYLLSARAAGVHTVVAQPDVERSEAITALLRGSSHFLLLNPPA